MKFLPPVIPLFLLLAVAVFPQTGGKNPSQPPNYIEPFQISKGKSFFVSTVPKQPVSEPRAEPNADQKLFDNQFITGDVEEAVKIIRQNYVGGKRLDFNEITKTSISAMLRTLDPHSHYFDSNEYNELLNDQQSEYYGIGATIVNYEKDSETNTYVVSTYPDSNAARADLRFGDKILAVDGQNMTGEDSADVRDKVRGKLGTTVHLKIERADSGKIENIDIKRSRVPQPSLPDAYILRDNVGYIDLSNGFNYTTAEELSAALKELHNQGVESLILDLRDNPGGIVDQAVKVVEKFVPNNSTVLTQRGRFRGDNIVWRAVNKTPESMPLVVLVNENTASASEIVSGALQDYDRALIVGQRTFGKGLVQSIINLPYNSGLTLTTARYYTPSGRSIQRDYSHLDNYDYFNHKVNLTEADKNKFQATTISGRKVYGGNGIEPDFAVKADSLTALQARMLDPLFFFAKDLANGKIAKFENYKIVHSDNYGKRIGRAEFPVSDELVQTFLKYVQNNSGWKLDGNAVQNEKDFIKIRLRCNLVTAAFGSVSANQVLIENDSQIIKAVSVLPQAQQLAQNAKKVRIAQK